MSEQGQYMDEMEDKIGSLQCRLAAERAAREKAEKERDKLKAVILDVFSVDPSMAEEGCDIIGHSIDVMSKEIRLTIINTLRIAKENSDE